MKPVQPRNIGRRDLLRGAGGLAALGLAAACGSNTGREGAGGEGLSVWYHQYGEAGTKEAALRYAKAYDKASVKVQWTPGDYASKLSSGLLSNQGPDVFESQLNIGLVQSKQIVALDDIIGPVKSDYNPIDIETNTIDGKIYGVRMIDDPQLFYYRKSMFDKAGLPVPETFDDLIKTAKALTKGKTKGIFVGNDAGMALGPAMLHSVGASFLTEGDSPKPNFTAARTAAGLRKLHELYTSGGVLKQGQTDWADPSSFTQEAAAIQWCGLWAMPGIKKELGDDFGVFALPKLDAEGQPAVYAGGWTAFVSAKSKKIDEAKAFVKWLWIDQTKYQEDWSLNYGFHIPPRKSLAAKAKKLQSGQAAEAVKLWEQHAITDNPRWTPKMASAFGDALAAIVKKGADPQASLGKASGIVNKELERLAK